MSEILIEGAIRSVIQPCVEMEEPVFQLKEIYRRVKQLETKEEKASLAQLIKNLMEGVPLTVEGIEYVLVLKELLSLPRGGLVKRLSRSKAQTKNPEQSRQTLYKRNSRVITRGRAPVNWRTNQKAGIEAKMKSSVILKTQSVYQAEKQFTESTQLDQRKKQISEKKLARARKKLETQELVRRELEGMTIEEKKVLEVMSFLEFISEKNGLANSDKIKLRVEKAIKSNDPLPILFVWGPPYEGQGKDIDLFKKTTPEKIMLGQILTIIKKFSTFLKIQPILLYADYYGQEINGMNGEEVDVYASNLLKEFSKSLPDGTNGKFIKWSVIREENKENYFEYRSLLQKDITPTEANIKNASLVQKKLGKNPNKKELERMVGEYQLERKIEALILEEGFDLNGERIKNLIKLGTAPSRAKNDEPYEEGLPRLYVKNLLRAAWNKSRERK